MNTKKKAFQVDDFAFDNYQKPDFPEFVRCISESWMELLEQEGHPEGRKDALKERFQALKDSELSSHEKVISSLGSKEEGQGFLTVVRPQGHQPGDPIAACIGAHFSTPFELELIRLFVDKKYRGYGLATKLINLVLQYAQQYGYERVILYCGSTSGQACYKRCGFHVTREYFFWKTVPNTRKLARVALLGGIHGNELVGPHLVQEVWKDPQHPDLVEASGNTFTVDLVLANPEATRRCIRFVDRDLNRCFELDELENPKSENSKQYETQRSIELNNLLGPKQVIRTGIGRWKPNHSKEADYLIDMHGTTSNMGICLITLTTDPLTYRIAHRVKLALEKQPDFPPFNLLIDDFDRYKYNNIDSLPPSGLCIEVGPQAHGTLNNLALLKGTHLAALEALREIRDFNLRDNSQKVTVDFATHQPVSLRAFKLWKPVHFPRSAPESVTVSAAIDPSLVGKDFTKKLQKGDSLFVDLVTGKTVKYYEEDEPAFACFIGEAAYFTSNIAMWLCREEEVFVYG